MISSPWARRRKLIYTSVVVGVLVLLASIQLFRVLYEPPNCFDGWQNQSETGVDCGGECLRICEEDTADLRVLWERVFEIRNGVFTAVANIENSNSTAGIRDISYSFEIQDHNGEVIETVEGSTFVLPNSRFPVFAGPFELSREPFQTYFSFTSEPVWVETESVEQTIQVEDTTLLSSETSPKLRAVISNTTIQDIEDVGVVALVSSTERNVVAASRTVVDLLPSEESEDITFTWPDAFDESQGICEVPTGVVLAIDRSGSMNDDASDPPQPITDVLDAAETFVANLRQGDRVGVVSFATNASNPIDLKLSSSLTAASTTISNISIRPEDENGYTNMGDALRMAYEEIASDPSFDDDEREFVIVLLTDGEANYPETPGGETYAREQAAIAKRMGISLYTIGLGEGVNRGFLQELATAPNYYFEAASTDDLIGIYEEIGTSVCALGPAVIELFPRFNNVPELR